MTKIKAQEQPVTSTEEQSSKITTMKSTHLDKRTKGNGQLSGNQKVLKPREHLQLSERWRSILVTRIRALLAMIKISTTFTKTSSSNSILQTRARHHSLRWRRCTLKMNQIWKDTHKLKANSVKTYQIASRSKSKRWSLEMKTWQICIQKKNQWKKMMESTTYFCHNKTKRVIRKA